MVGLSEGAIHVEHRWGDSTKRSAPSTIAEPARRKLMPLAYVAFENHGRKQRGMLLALTDEWAWLRNAAGAVVKSKRAQLEVRAQSSPKSCRSDKPLQPTTGS